jgi:hypothetical protein
MSVARGHKKSDPVRLRLVFAHRLMPFIPRSAHRFACRHAQNPCEELRRNGIRCMESLNVHGQGGVAVSDTDLKAQCQETFEAYRLCLRAWNDAQAEARERERASAAAARAKN